MLLVFVGCFGCDVSGEIYEPPTDTYDVGGESADWRAALEGFLGEFLPLFTSLIDMGGWEMDGWFEFFRPFDEAETLADGSEIWWAFYDPVSGRRVTENDVPFIRERERISTGFALYDLNGDGVPVIVISFGVPQTSDIGHVVYAFVDDEFREIGFAGASFFRDGSGNLITESSEPGMAAYFTFDFDGRNARIGELIIEGNFDDDEIVAFHSTLTPVERLAELQESVVESVTARLLAEGRVQ